MKKIAKRSECPVSFGLDFWGDKWTLLIIRDIVMNDKHTFGEFLQSGEGIATNILTSRLKMLENEGFIFKYPVPGKARIAYCLTPKGISVIPIVVEMGIWGESHLKTSVKAELTAAIKSNKPLVIKQMERKHLKIYEQRKAETEAPA